MELSYWQSRWQKGKTGWHMQQVYPHLDTFWDTLNLKAGARVLVPLCGKSLDMPWLVQNGHHIIGVDVSAKAIDAAKDTLNMSFRHSKNGHFDIYSADSVDLYVGDFLKMQQSYLPKIDAIYDKAALIALPDTMRKNYTETVKNLCQPHTKMLLTCFEYPQHEMNGPPFAVFNEQLHEYYGEQFSINLLHQEPILEQLPKFKQRGLSSFLTEKVYLLSPANG